MNFKKYLELFRIHTLSASYIPVIFGSLYAYYRTGEFSLSLFLAMLLASVSIQIATNLFNEYFDFKKGLDTVDSVGQSGSIVKGELSAQKVLAIAISFIAFSMLLGLFIIVKTSIYIALVGFISILVGYLYTGGPRPIAYGPLGELFAGFFMGNVIIGISYFIQTMDYTLEVFLVSLPFALLISSILTANNIRDIDEDIEGGRRTLVILLGKEGGITFLKSIFYLAYLSLPVLICLKYLPIVSILALANISSIKKAEAIFISKNTPAEMMPAMGIIAINNARFGLAMIASLALDLLIF